MNFDFGDVLSRAWQIIWKHKVLWIFGILAGCSRGSSGFRGSSGGGGGDNGGTGQLPPEAMRILQIIQQNLALTTGGDFFLRERWRGKLATRNLWILFAL